MTDAASCGTCRPEAISTEGLIKRYGDACVVDHVDLTVPERAVYGFLGPNGAGKSTTMKMLLGLTHPNEGTATVLGCPLLPENRLEVLRNVGSLIESPCCYPRLTARENLEIVRRLRGLPESEIDEALSIVGLDGPAARKKAAGNFPLGMRQRLGIAAPLMGKPPLLLLDEPTNGLDPSGIHEICSLVGSLPERFDVTVVVSSHLLSEIDQMADHVGIIDGGRMVWQGALAGLHAMGRRWIALKTTDNRLAAQLLPGAQADDDPSYLRIKMVDDRKAAQVSTGRIGPVPTACRRGAGTTSPPCSTTPAPQGSPSSSPRPGAVGSVRDAFRTPRSPLSERRSPTPCAIPGTSAASRSPWTTTRPAHAPSRCATTATRRPARKTWAQASATWTSS